MLNRSAKLLRPCDGNCRAISTPPLMAMLCSALVASIVGA
jgi:hypothetical protein